MSLAPGSRVGLYEVIAQIGAGGMGEVYRARDARLQRDVALKVLIAAVADDPDRLARFSREAQVLAALNHPNIAAIFGIEEDRQPSGSHVSALVMELVEGPTLADRLAGGPLPLDESLAIAKQITEALAAAHESGIIHRDLKPANIKVKDDGTVKVLDFGLAKAIEPAGASASVANSPTLSVHATQQGLILGTAAYMAPEQARGRVVDRRADIWAFGAVLYEMLAGRRAFDGDDISITLASVLKEDVDWSALPTGVPPSVRRLLRRCLEKDPRRRLSSIADARLELEDATNEPAVPTVTSAVVPAASRLPWAIAVAMTLLAVAAIAMWRPWVPEPSPQRLAFSITAPDRWPAFGTAMAISPDGRRIVTRGGTPGDVSLWLHSFDTNTSAFIAGTDGGNYPFWSPDSRYIGFFADGKIKRVDTAGGLPTAIADAPQSHGAAWSRDNVILFAPTSAGALFRISPDGGEPVQVTTLDSSKQQTAHRLPSFLSDGDHFVYFAESDQPEHQGVYLDSLASSQPRLLIASGSGAVVAPQDILLFARDARLLAQRLDMKAGALSGEPMRIAEEVYVNSGGQVAAHATDAVVAFLPRNDDGSRRMVWMNADGKIGATVGGAARYDNPRLSPDGSKLAVSIGDDASGDIWIHDLARGTSTRFTFDDAIDNVPVWSPDGKRIAFVSSRGGHFNIYGKSAGGTGEDELLLKTDRPKLLNDWSQDGRYLLYQELSSEENSDLWALPLFGDRKPVPILSTPFSERAGTFSPDGKWIMYTSNESGNSEVYIQSFPPSSVKWQVSTGRGSQPRWRPDGKRLFYDRVGTLMSVDVLELTHERFRAGAPTPLFTGLMSIGPHNLDVTADGQRFLIVTNRLNVSPAPISIGVVLNWKSGLN